MLTGYMGCFWKTLIGVIAISHGTKAFRLFSSFKSTISRHDCICANFGLNVKVPFFCSISAQRGSASGSYSNLIIEMVLGSCFSDLNFLQYWSPSLKYPTRIRLNVRFGVYFLWTLKGVTFFLGFPHRGTRSL